MKEKVVRLLNATDIIKETGIGRTTLWRLVKAGKITPILYGSAKVYRLKDVQKVWQPKSYKKP